MKEQPIKRAMAKVNGLNLFYRDTLSGDQTIFCLHGRWGRGETWTDLMARYRDRYRIIAPDQRGHGLGDKPIARYAGEDMATDAYELIQQLGCAPVIVVGHSMGARIGAYLTARYPQVVKAFALLDCGVSGPTKRSETPPEQIPAIDELTRDWHTPYPTYDAALRDLQQRFRATGVRYFLDSLVETVAGYDFLFSRYAIAAIKEYAQDWHHLLPQIQCPVLFVRAKESWALAKEEADKMRSLIKHCTYFEVSNSDHMVYADNPDEFYPQFDQFLRELSDGSIAKGNPDESD